MKVAELEPLLAALAFAAHKHKDQRRKDADASPYINHPIDLAALLVHEAGVTELEVLCAALLHDTIEDTDTSPRELEQHFGATVCRIVEEVSDDPSLPSDERKRLQVVHAPHISRQARLVKLADKICNLRDMSRQPPQGWDLARRQRYFDWAREVIAGVRGTHPGLEALFDQAFKNRPDKG
jgi:guanosine-3',5'-bis(diphosphate) 3'-pyrophosphohydrolase